MRLSFNDLQTVLEILRSYGEYGAAEKEKSFTDDDGTFHLITSSCGGGAIKALLEAGFSVYVFRHIDVISYLDIHIYR